MSETSQNSWDKQEIRLAHLANDWRKFHSQAAFDRADLVVNEYHKVMKELWESGWRGNDLLPDCELPAELMPSYFFDYWKRSF